MSTWDAQIRTASGALPSMSCNLPNCSALSPKKNPLILYRKPKRTHRTGNVTALMPQFDETFEGPPPRFHKIPGGCLKPLYVIFKKLNPLCDIPSGCCSFTGPWTVTRSSLRMLRRVAAFCRPLRPVLLLVLFSCSRSLVVGVLGLC